jgi:nitrite reductase [NAD(P)H] small subunit
VASNLMKVSNWVRVCAVEDVPPFEGRRTQVEGFYVGIFHTEEGFYAIGDVCPHLGGPLSDGILAGTEVSCPLHNRRVALKSGKVVNDELGCVPAFPVEVRNGTIYVDVSGLKESPV